MKGQFEAVISALGKPYFRSERCAIYNLDCVKAMADLSAAFSDPGVFRLTVTSPPYNIGKEYEDVRPLAEYLEWCETWMTAIHGLTSNDGAFWLNVGYVPVEEKGKAVPLPYLLWDKSPFFMIQEVVWHYGAGVAARNSLSPRNEKFLWYVKDSDNYVFNLDDIRDPNVKYPNQKKGGVLRVNPNGKNPSDVWIIPKVTSGRASKERTAHPAQFPVGVIERVIRGSSNENDLILDPFLGSGTAAEVALRNHRYVIGFEIREDYCKIATRRIQSVITELSGPKQQKLSFSKTKMQKTAGVVEDEEEEEEVDEEKSFSLSLPFLKP